MYLHHLLPVQSLSLALVVILTTYDLAHASLRNRTSTGYPWAKDFDIETEDQELSLAGLQYKRLIQAGAADWFNMVQLSKPKSSPSGEPRLESRQVVNQPKEVDITLGTGRATCLEIDKPGGPTAILGSDCIYNEWFLYRKHFLDTVRNINFDVEELKHHPTDVEPSLNIYLKEMLKKFEELKEEHEKNHPVRRGDLRLFEFFQQLCIACTGDPLLQCDRRTQKCSCWDFYVKEKSEESDVDDCRIGVGGRCHHTEGAECVTDAFCDQNYVCKCRTRKTCVAVGAGSYFSPGGMMIVIAGLILAVATLLF